MSTSEEEDLDAGLDPELVDQVGGACGGAALAWLTHVGQTSWRGAAWLLAKVRRASSCPSWSAVVTCDLGAAGSCRVL